MTRKLLTTTAILFACACSSSGGDPAPTPAKTTLTIDEYLASADSIDCLVYYCGFGLSRSLCSGADAATIAATKKAIADKRLTFDGTAAKTCVDAAAKAIATCWGPTAQSDTEEPACQAVLEPAVADAGACFNGDECLSNACDSTAQVCPGKCSTLKKVGADCGMSSECEKGLRCILDKCAQKSVAAGPCDFDSDCADGFACGDDSKCAAEVVVAENGACKSSSECAKGLWCSTPAGKKCVKKIAAGGECDDLPFFLASTQCAGNQTCAGTIRTTEGVYTQKGKCAVPAGLGGACTPKVNATDSVSTGCFLDLVCDPATKKCAELPKLGQPCIAGRCTGSYCEGSTCTARKKAGAACQSGNECEGDCDFDTEKCVDVEEELSCEPPK